MADPVYDEARKILADLSTLPSGMLSVGDLQFLWTKTRWSAKGPWSVGDFDESDLARLKEMREQYFSMMDG